MPLLYESVVQTKKVRAKSVSRQLQEEAPFWRVVEVYKVGSIYMTPEQLKSEIQKAVNQAATEKGLKVLSWRVLDMWAEWKGVYTEYYCRYEAYFGEASSMAKTQMLVIPIATIIICLTVIVGLLIILFIVLVAREAVEAVFQWVPSEAKPYVATLLLVGLGLLVVGGGVYLIKSVIPKIKRK
jgi:hypothetical protein